MPDSGDSWAGDTAPKSQRDQLWRVDEHVFIRWGEELTERREGRGWVEDERSLPREGKVETGDCGQNVAKQRKGAGSVEWHSGVKCEHQRSRRCEVHHGACGANDGECGYFL